MRTENKNKKKLLCKCAFRFATKADQKVSFKYLADKGLQIYGGVPPTF